MSLLLLLRGRAPVVTTTAVVARKVELELPLPRAGHGFPLLFFATGTPTRTWTDVTADVERLDSLVIVRGMRGGGPTDRVAPPSQVSFTLNNSERNAAKKLGYYSLYHPNKRDGFGLGIRCRVQLQDPETGDWHIRFKGRVDAVRPIAGQNGIRATYLVAKSWLDEASRWTLTPNVPLQIDKRWEEITETIISYMPTSPEGTDFDAGGNKFPFALDTSIVTQQSLLAELAKLARSEFGFVYEKADGPLKLEGRHSRLANTTIVWSLTDQDMQDLTVPSTRDEIINTVRVTVHPRTVDAAATTVVYRQANTIPIEPGETKTLIGPYRDEVTGDPIGATEIQPQVAGVDYLANDQEDGLGSNVTSAISIAVNAGPSGAQFLVTNTGFVRAFLLSNMLVGRAIKDQGTQTLQAQDVASIQQHGEHPVNFDMDYQDDTSIGQGAADYLLQKYKDPFAQARTVRVVARTSAQLAKVVNREISDRIAIRETVTGVDNEFFINGERLTVRPDGYVEVTYTLAPARDPLQGQYWILGTSVLGVNTVPAPF